MPFRIEETNHAPDIGVLRVFGELGSSGVRELHRRLGNNDGIRGLVVDLTGVTFIEPSLLGWLVTAVIRMRPRAGRLVVLCPDPAKRQIFELVGLERVFPIETSFDAALRELE